MKYVMLVALVVFSFGCKSPAVQAILQPLAAGGCAVETAMTQNFGQQIVRLCQGTDAVACGKSVLVGLGNVNLCNMAVPTTTVSALTSHPEWKKVGDIPASALKGAQGKAIVSAVQTMGVIGSLVCPIGVGVGMGLLSAQIPVSCGCTTNLSASALDDAFVAACELAVGGI